MKTKLCLFKKIVGSSFSQSKIGFENKINLTETNTNWDVLTNYRGMPGSPQISTYVVITSSFNQKIIISFKSHCSACFYTF